VQKNLILNIQYDGTNYSGWQIQPNAITIQGKLQNVLKELTGLNLNIIAAGRTDAGVHAKNMTAHAKIDDNFNLPDTKIKAAINSILPNDIRINKAIVYNGEFHSRFDALKREYHYYLMTDYNVFRRLQSGYYKYPIDEKKLLATSGLFEMTADFTTFSKINPDIKNNKCIIDLCKWEKIDENYFVLKIRANHFLYGMVRALTGAMLDIARGKRDKRDVLIALQQQNRQLASPLAPPQGLFFAKAFYNNEIEELLV
jgi:tRNA pseudouridine38-40 synthase